MTKVENIQQYNNLANSLSGQLHKAYLMRRAELVEELHNNEMMCVDYKKKLFELKDKPHTEVKVAGLPLDMFVRNLGRKIDRILVEITQLDQAWQRTSRAYLVPEVIVL